MPVIDGHNDTLLGLALATRLGEARDFVAGTSSGHVDLPRLNKGGVAIAFFACFVPASLAPDDQGPTRVATADGWEVPYAPTISHSHAVETTLALASRLYALERASAGRLRVVRSAPELDRCIAGEAIGAILHLEGAEAVDPGLHLLPVYHALGVRSIGIVWSRANAFGRGVPFRYPASPDFGDGLTPAGRDLVDACNDIGLVVDLAHLNARGFWDVAERSRAPLVVTHSAAHALAPHARNLTDDQLRAVGDADGIVGLNLGVGDLRADGDPTATDVPLERIVEHVEHIASLIGEDHVGLGSDFDGATMPRAIGDAAGVQAIVGALRDAGVGEAAIRKFAHGNWQRVLRATWGDGQATTLRAAASDGIVKNQCS